MCVNTVKPPSFRSEFAAHTGRQAAAMAVWLAPQKFDCFLTLTFKQGMAGVGHTAYLTRERLEATINHVMNNLARSAFGNKAFKRGKKISYATYAEGDGFDKRQHAHVYLRLPNDWSIETMKIWVQMIIPKVDWLRAEFHVRDIDNWQRALWYCQGSGPDAFCPNATRIPTLKLV